MKNPDTTGALIGLQAAGKSTFHRTRFAETHLLVSRDVDRGSAARQVKMVGAALAFAMVVVVASACGPVEPKDATGAGEHVAPVYLRDLNTGKCVGIFGHYKSTYVALAHEHYCTGANVGRGR